MQSVIIKLEAKKLVGMSTRTNNKNEFNITSAKIPICMDKYFSKNLCDKISNRKTPGITYAIYTNYESDHNGDYTYFLGEEVTGFDECNSQFEALMIPVQNYVKFTTSRGKMPDVVINVWQKVWSIKDNELGGERKYLADFEIYDRRAVDPNDSIVDIYIGIK